MQISAFEIDAFDGCVHGVPLDFDCELCEAGHAFGITGRHGTRDDNGRYVNKYESTYMLCPHGSPIPLGDTRRLLRVSARNTFCEACEQQRADARAQDNRLEQLKRTMPRQPRVTKQEDVQWQRITH